MAGRWRSNRLDVLLTGTAAAGASCDGAALRSPGACREAASVRCGRRAQLFLGRPRSASEAAARPAAETLSARVAALIREGGAVAAADLVKDKHGLTVSIVHSAS
jgi:hypothetical protein